MRLKSLLYQLLFGFKKNKSHNDTPEEELLAHYRAVADRQRLLGTKIGEDTRIRFSSDCKTC